MTNHKLACAFAAVSVSVLAPASGCIPSEYQRDDMPPGAGEGPPVSSYAISADDTREGTAQGAVHVISLGSERLPVPAGQPDTYVHFRLAADNLADDTPWTFHPNEQLLLYGLQAARPTFSETSGGAPVLKIERGKRGFIDVYYPLPAEDTGTTVKLAWRLRRGARMAAKTTEFSRTSGADTAYVYYQPSRGYHVYTGLGLDTWWWQDYYFWNRGGLWWPCPRFYVHSHYPHYGGRTYVNRGGGGGGDPGRPIAGTSRPSGASGWRGYEGSAGQSSGGSGKSSWRGSLSPSTYTSTSTSDSGSSSSSSSSSSSGSSGSSSSGSSGSSSSGSSGGSSSGSSGGGSSPAPSGGGDKRQERLAGRRRPSGPCERPTSPPPLPQTGEGDRAAVGRGRGRGREREPGRGRGASGRGRERGRGRGREQGEGVSEGEGERLHHLSPGCRGEGLGGRGGGGGGS